MKHARILIFIIPLLGLIFHSCDKIKSPYAVSHHGNVTDTVMDWDTVVAIKKVLLEDYTGHKCVNCPQAAVIALTLEEYYGGRLLVMAVHAGFYAEPSSAPFTADYTTATGDSWNNEFGITSNPNGLIDRKDFGSGKIISTESWSSSVGQIINQTPQAIIVMINNFDSASAMLKATVYTHFLSPLPGTYKLCLCITEDSLYSAQKNSNPQIDSVPVIYHYRFMDVLRGSINGAWGEILTSSVNTDLTYMYRLSFALNAGWKPKNCWLYAFVFRDDTKEIIQVERRRISN